MKRYREKDSGEAWRSLRRELGCHQRGNGLRHRNVDLSLSINPVANHPLTTPPRPPPPPLALPRPPPDPDPDRASDCELDLNDYERNRMRFTADSKSPVVESARHAMKPSGRSNIALLSVIP